MYQQHVLEWLTVEQLSAVMKALIIDANAAKNRSKPSMKFNEIKPDLSQVEALFAVGGH
ncbi:Uncharacterised protein [Klebsiella pneumoniae subsp. ozaenae]|uniref:Uncharacterized protein n=1 Tax=Klebsiella pneumoniae subsp. ozaenae TaxID=574 RepID=A0A378C5A4_KLEPO|nr:Uncharacterised protein [Klebsiella pneumoniae subsp. ozaenae]